MNKKRLKFLLISCFACAALLLYSAGTPRSAQEAPEAAPALSAAPPAPAADLPERPVFIKIPEIFEELDRAPVKFLHDKHARALEDEGCEACHPKSADGEFDFAYPKKRDESGRDALMNSFHDDCTGCHTRRAAEGLKAGPVTCGECHRVEAAYLEHQYLPVLPGYYEPLRDTYHRDCMSCHQDPAKAAEEAGGLSWKSFYVKEKQRLEIQWPPVGFDYAVHDKHAQALEKKCELCHYLSPEARRKLEAEGKEPACKDWLNEIPAGESLTEQETAHPRCINCHLKKKGEQKDGGPVFCMECHTGRVRTIEALKDVPRSECEQEDRMLIQLEKDARMKGAAFDHKAHQQSSRSCQECHHDTLQACSVCHTLQGSEEGGAITLAESYHATGSTWSCVGCHEAEKQKPDCAGCHHLRETGLVESACSRCHSGALEALDGAGKLEDPEGLMPEDTKQEMELALIENEYEPSKLTHLAIAKKLTEISNNSRLAAYFHQDPLTICAGCHHLGPMEKNAAVPQCRTCHTVRKEPFSRTPTLLGAYHQQCLGCHRQMGGPEEKMPQKCAGCHEEKKKSE